MSGSTLVHLQGFLVMAKICDFHRLASVEKVVTADVDYPWAKDPELHPIP